MLATITFSANGAEPITTVLDLLAVPSPSSLHPAVASAPRQRATSVRVRAEFRSMMSFLPGGGSRRRQRFVHRAQIGPKPFGNDRLLHAGEDQLGGQGEHADEQGAGDDLGVVPLAEAIDDEPSESTPR